ncbi:DUF4249 domain-containing protein [Hymenobacter arizonensis]|uniref:DUF4249 domain-containing protein n=1 Tax=Hymenobacter arizonensis TaxID=1227077 RepID=A0A1I5ZS24_HYMAR|nr:DUF4249 domain-containing protein [Hymenobacter arizonensis]SFQ59279.1 protein of unknown function [Hymenobacter arizonensis]
MKYISLTLLLAAAALAGCETTVDLPEPPHTPRVSLLYTLTTAPQDSSFQELYTGRQLYISNSQRVFDTRELTGRRDATVELRNASGSVVERYRPLSGANSSGGYQGYYRPVLGFQPQSGQTYTLRAALPGLETVESTLTMPAPAVVESATYVPRTNALGGNANDNRGRLTVVLRDDPAVANYYLAFAQVLDQQGRPGDNGSGVYEDFDSDIGASIGRFQLSSPRQQEQYSIYPFADTDVSGQRITLTSDVRLLGRTCFRGSCSAPAFIEVHIASITAEAYNFYLSRRRYFDSDGNPFAEPAPLASNVRSGYGLLGGAADVTYRIRL